MPIHTIELLNAIEPDPILLQIKIKDIARSLGDRNLWFSFSILASLGAAGGIAYKWTQQNERKLSYFTHILTGAMGAIVMSLIVELDYNDPIFKVLAWSMIGGYSSLIILDAFKGKLEASMARQELVVAKQETQTATESVRKISRALNETSESSSQRKQKTALAPDKRALAFLTDNKHDNITRWDDPQKGLWNGASRNGSYEIKAYVETLTEDTPTVKALFLVRLAVKSTDPLNAPLNDGDVVRFYLHDSFRMPVRAAVAFDGAAELIVRAYGAFTVGVKIESNATELELDLSELSDAPKVFRER